MRPMLVGRWGYSDPGSDAILTGVHRPDPGERLGDLVLAAESRVGAGTVVVLGDPACLTNESLGKCYEFTARLLGHLAARGGGPLSAWRQAVALVLLAGLVVLLVRRPNAASLAATAVAVSITLAFCLAVQSAGSQVVPDGRTESGNFLACIDGSHLEPFADEPWDPAGIEGLELTLMRNGYLPIVVPRVTDEQLQRADIFISISPSRPFSDSERAALRRFVEGGGLLLVMAGGDRAEAANVLLEDYKLRIPAATIDSRRANESLPMVVSNADGGDTRFFQPYRYKKGVTANVYFQAAWPVECWDDGRTPLIYDAEKRTVAMSVQVGKGKVIAIGDATFALNANLEDAGGAADDSRAENVRFWRWLLAWANGREVEQ
jgi:hypothetical protein